MVAISVSGTSTAFFTVRSARMLRLTDRVLLPQIDSGHWVVTHATLVSPGVYRIGFHPDPWRNFPGRLPKSINRTDGEVVLRFPHNHLLRVVNR